MVKERLRQKAKPRIEALKKKVQTRIETEHKSEKMLEKLNREVFREEAKQKQMLSKSRAAEQEKARAADDEEDEGDGEQEEEKEEDETGDPMVGITSLLLVILEIPEPPPHVPGQRKRAPSKKKKAFALTLWDDGPDITPVSNFQEADKFIMKEYNVAADRGAMDAACMYCTNSAKLPQRQHDKHLEWHRKYRLFFVEREARFPGLKDNDATRTWSAEEKVIMLDELVNIWLAIDEDAVWMNTRGYVDWDRAASA